MFGLPRLCIFVCVSRPFFFCVFCRRGRPREMKTGMKGRPAKVPAGTVIPAVVVGDKENRSVSTHTLGEGGHALLPLHAHPRVPQRCAPAQRAHTHAHLLFQDAREALEGAGPECAARAHVAPMCALGEGGHALLPLPAHPRVPQRHAPAQRAHMHAHLLSQDARETLEGAGPECAVCALNIDACTRGGRARAPAPPPPGLRRSRRNRN